MRDVLFRIDAEVSREEFHGLIADQEGEIKCKLQDILRRTVRDFDFDQLAADMMEKAFRASIERAVERFFEPWGDAQAEVGKVVDSALKDLLKDEEIVTRLAHSIAKERLLR